MATRVVVDRRRDIALVFFLCSVGGMFFGLRSDSVLETTTSWVAIGSVLVAAVVGIGIWRASEWARWTGGIIGVLRAVGLAALPVMAWTGSSSERLSTRTTAIVFSSCFVVFWAAIAFYLLKPSTKRLFAHIRSARKSARPATS